VVLYSESTELISLALTAVQCMTDVAVARETVKFKYSTQNDIKKEVINDYSPVTRTTAIYVHVIL
jgi:hypothetical protein